MDILQRFNDMEQYHIVNNIYKYMKHPIVENTNLSNIVKKWSHHEYAYRLYSYEQSDNQIIYFYNYFFASYKHNLLQNKYYINLNSYGYWNIKYYF